MLCHHDVRQTETTCGPPSMPWIFFVSGPQSGFKFIRISPRSTQLPVRWDWDRRAQDDEHPGRRQYSSCVLPVICRRIHISQPCTVEIAMSSQKKKVIDQIWIDGLGNPQDNKLARCQLRRLVARARLLQAPDSRSTTFVVLWIDTICIPGESKGDPLDLRRQTLEKRAIVLMTPIYAKAKRVLILDSELDSLSHNNFSFSELTARFRVCGWMNRA